MIFDIVSNRNPARPARRHFASWLSAAAILCAAAPASAETLQDAVAAAYAQNPTLVGQRYLQKSTNERYVQTRGQYGPSVSVSATASYDYTKLHSFENDSNAGELTLSVRQPVYTGGRLRGALAEARANVRGSEETLRQIEAEVIRDVIIAYAAVLRDQRRLEVARENVEVLKAQFRERQARRRVRDVTITDVAQSDVRLAAGESQLATAEAQLAVSRGEYLRVVGREPVDLQPLPDLPGVPVSIDEAFEIADTDNPRLAAVRYAENASRANIATQRAAQRPSATISALGGYSGTLSPFDRREYRTNAQAQITVTQPLFQSGVVRSRIRQSQDLNNADQAAVDAQRRQTLQDVTAAWSQLASARVAVTSGSRQVQAAQIVFAGMQREERFGLRSTTEVLNSEQELASSQLSLLQNRYQEYVSRASLLLAMGRLDARTVNSAMLARDPEAAFREVRFRGMTPIEPVTMILDHVGSASPYSKRKPDLRGQGQPRPTGAPALPETPDRTLTDTPLIPIAQSQLVPADQLSGAAERYETSPETDAAPR